MSSNVIHVTENNFKTMCDIVFNDDYIIKEKYYTSSAIISKDFNEYKEDEKYSKFIKTCRVKECGCNIIVDYLPLIPMTITFPKNVIKINCLINIWSKLVFNNFETFKITYPDIKFYYPNGDITQYFKLMKLHITDLDFDFIHFVTNVPEKIEKVGQINENNYQQCLADHQYSPPIKISHNRVQKQRPKSLIN